MSENLRATPVDVRRAIERGQHLPSVSAVIDAAVQQQAKPEARARWNSLIKASERKESVMDGFVGSPFFSEVHTSGVKEIFRDKGEIHFRNQLAGAIFTKISYGMLSAREDVKGNTVLTPEQSQLFFQAVYPDAEPQKKSFNLIGVPGKYVPDGIIVTKQGKISLLEYTIAGSGIDELLPRYQKMRQELGQMNRDATLHVVTAAPSSNNRYLKTLRSPEITWEILSFQTGKFSEIVDLMMNHQPDDVTPSFNDIFEERELQRI